MLDLSSTASSDDAEAAYRDLIKVWHPDRFPSDRRLKERAEEKTKQLNEAMSIIRNHASIEQPCSSPSPESQQTSPDKTYHQSTQPRGSETTERMVRPLHAHRRFRTSLLYVFASAALLAIGYTSLLRPGISTYTAAFATAVALWAMHEMIEDIFIAALHLPIFSMSREGIRIFGLGSFGWRDLQEVESRLQHRSAIIAIRLSQQRLATYNILFRMLLRLRSLVFRAHYIVPFSDLTISPSAFVALARHHFAYAIIHDSPMRRQSGALRLWLNGVQFVCVILAVGWYLFGHDTHPVEVLPYFALSALCQAFGLTYQRLKRS